jgi:hypothetical protein
VSSSAFAQMAPEVEVCRLSGLAALKERSPSIEHLTFDPETLAVSKAAATKVEDTGVKMVVMGDAYIEREKGKVLLTFFTKH